MVIVVPADYENRRLLGRQRAIPLTVRIEGRSAEESISEEAVRGEAADLARRNLPASDRPAGEPVFAVQGAVCATAYMRLRISCCFAEYCSAVIRPWSSIDLS